MLLAILVLTIFTQIELVTGGKMAACFQLLGRSKWSKSDSSTKTRTDDRANAWESRFSLLTCSGCERGVLGGNFVRRIIACALLLGLRLESVAQPEQVGERPYEMAWANRVQDDHPPLVDFEELSGWTVQCKEAQASFARTREQQIWGKYVGRLVYRGTGPNPEVRVVPPEPIPLADGIGAVSLWCYGNNWGWTSDPSTPRVSISAILEDSARHEYTVPLYSVDWKEWFLLHRRLTPEQISQLSRDGRFKALLITGGSNSQDRSLYFDNLAFFTESFPPLQFEPRPKRVLEPFAGQATGANTGPGKLPFPTREETILPDNLDSDGTNWVSQSGEGDQASYTLCYRSASGSLVFRLTPAKGTWSDISAQWSGPGQAEQVFAPCVDGGVFLTTPEGAALPQKAEHLGTRLDGSRLESWWRLSSRGGGSAEVTYIYRLWAKSLVIDVLAPAGGVSEVRFGRLTGLKTQRLVKNPFYPAEEGRPAVVVTGETNKPLFVSGNADWYRSSASILWAANSINAEGVTYNGGTRYLPLTSGRRNPCFERFFVTVSPQYEEVLPNIPNPPSPWRHITGTRLWRAHGASNREQDKRYWADVHRYGMTQMIVTDHETMWRDEGESFTFRTRAAPGKGGDESERDYSRFMQDQLGFVYGPYNNFTDFAPVNEFWSYDLISRDINNQLQHAWMRCYAPKPARAVEFCQRLAPQIQNKFHFSTAYCDVHTAVAPWHRVDYDPRVPGAGTFSAVFYAYGEIMLLQKQAWHGPVYSEGNYHCFYMGLTDGNYGQDQSYRPAENPWLVDFDLRKMHDLGGNFGMGNLEMFYANQPQPKRTQEDRDAELDRFLSATVAFGHPGFLVMEGGMENALRSYYMLQQLHSRYCLTNAAEICYVAADGRLLDTSQAVASGAFERSQVVTRYADGTFTAANGSRTERLRCEAFGRNLDLPPNGYAGWAATGPLEVLSSDGPGHRADYAQGPAYIYVDGRGKFARFARAAGNGQGICRILPNAQYEVILHQNPECGFAVDASTAVALDKENRELGPAQLRRSRGLTYVIPVKGAFSYRLTSAAERTNSQGHAATLPILPAPLSCNRDEVLAGETLVVQGKNRHEILIPADAFPGQRLWFQFENAWIDFTVSPLAQLFATLSDDSLRVQSTSHLAESADFSIQAGGKTQRLRLVPNRAALTTVQLDPPTREAAEILPVVLQSGARSQSFELGVRTVRGFAKVSSLSEHWTGGIGLRGQKETPEFGSSGATVHPQAIQCGEARKTGLFMHPPWQNGTGHCFALYDPCALPAGIPVAFRASVGKASGSDPGDGILYKLVVTDSSGSEAIAAQTTVREHTWQPIEADLSPWAGQVIRLKLIADAGPNDNSSGDWAAWADMRLESLRPVLHRQPETALERLRHRAGPHPLPAVGEAELRQARSGRLHYEGKGLDGPGAYGTQALLNGIILGELSAAPGSEGEGKFSESAGVPLSGAAIRALGHRNVLTIKNPQHDCFSIRNIRLELTLADGGNCSSDISTATYSQPPDWKYSEGIIVPSDEEIELDIWFP